MTTANQLYTNKDYRENFNLAVKKNFTAPVTSFYIEEGFNIRPTNRTHVEKLKEAYLRGEKLPKVIVEIKLNEANPNEVFKIVDGHHRLTALKEIIASGALTEYRLEFEEFHGDEKAKVEFMLDSSEGALKLTPVDLGRAYQRLSNCGVTIKDIATRYSRSPTDIKNHLDLVCCEENIVNAVQEGKMSYTTALEIQKQHGLDAGKVAQEALDEAAKTGAKKVKAKAIKEPAKKANYKQRALDLELTIKEILQDVELYQKHGTNINEALATISSKLQSAIAFEEVAQDG